MNAPIVTAHSPSSFCKLVDTLLPRGGMLMVLVEAYFDESIGEATVTDDDGSRRTVPLLCVAGYLIESEQSKLLSAEWQAVLDTYGLPYFHMVDCAHGNKAFRNLSKPDRIQIAARMIGLIKRYTAQGIATAVNMEQFNQIMPMHPLLGTPYTFSAHITIAGVQMWAQETRYSGDIAYFFEAGHASQSEANSVMEQLFSIPALKQDSHYISHTFVNKKRAPPVQAADLLAWQFYTDIRRKMEGETEARKDFASLCTHHHRLIYATPKRLREMASGWGAELPPEHALLELYLGTKRARKVVRATSRGRLS